MNPKVILGCVFVAMAVAACARPTAVVQPPLLSTVPNNVPDPTDLYGGGSGQGGMGSGVAGGGIGQGGAGGGVVGGGMGTGPIAGGGTAGIGQGGGAWGGPNAGGYPGISNGIGGAGLSPYTPADLNNPASILAQRIIYFDYDQASIRAEYLPVLDAHASLLAAYPNLRVRLEGHADERGSREYNVALSERRGYAVRDYLARRGLRQSQAEIVGFGEEVPATLGQGERSWSENRRVEIIYLGE